MTNSNEKFKNDLKSGEKYEDIIINLLEQSGFTFKNKSDINNKIERKEFDLIMIKNNREYKFEVKSDYFNYETENEIFEYFCNKSRSGILSTTADFWVTLYVLTNKIVIYKVRELKEFILNIIQGTTDYNYNKVYGGDGERAKIILVKYYDMKNYIKNRLVINYEIPVFDVENVLTHFNKKNKKYFKIINKLKSMC